MDGQPNHAILSSGAQKLKCILVEESRRYPHDYCNLRISSFVKNLDGMGVYAQFTALAVYLALGPCNPKVIPVSEK